VKWVVMAHMAVSKVVSKVLSESWVVLSSKVDNELPRRGELTSHGS
jgi:hypothetical protein